MPLRRDGSNVIWVSLGLLEYTTSERELEGLHHLRTRIPRVLRHICLYLQQSRNEFDWPLSNGM